jgi:hypothetical protein
MSEDKMNIVLEALAETIQHLRVDILILKGENERLKEKIKAKEEKVGTENA